MRRAAFTCSTVASMFWVCVAVMLWTAIGYAAPIEVVPMRTLRVGLRVICTENRCGAIGGVDQWILGERAKPVELVHPKGGDPSEWPDEDLRVREFPR